MEQELEEVKIEKQLRKRRSESPEKESEHEVIKLSAPKMTKGQITKIVSFKNRFITCAHVFLIIFIVVAVLVFCMVQIITIRKDASVEIQVRINEINTYINIIIFVFGWILPGPFNSTKKKTQKKKAS